MNQVNALSNNACLKDLEGKTKLNIRSKQIW